MAVDHLIYNKQKWYQIADNAEQVTAGGKQWLSCPKKVTVNDINSSVGFNVGYLSSGTYEVVGTSDKYYIIHAQDGYMVINKTDAKNVIWGGDSLLLVAVLFPRKEIAWC